MFCLRLFVLVCWVIEDDGDVEEEDVEVRYV